MGTQIKELEQYVEAIKEIIMNHPNTELAKSELEKIEEFQDFRTSLTSETDRGSVLMAAAFIEDKLLQMLKDFMVKNKSIQKKIFEGNGALATFSSKIQMAYLLGLIPKNIFDDLNILKRLRNDFAHNAKPISFKTDYVKDRCNALQVVSKTAFRDDTKAYFLRAMTTILTYIHLKTDSFERCVEENDYFPTKLDKAMEKVAEVVK